jgi:hypothetical protein
MSEHNVTAERAAMVQRMVGYFGIVYPERDLWQGYFLMPGSYEDGARVLEQARSLVVDRSENASGPIPAEHALTSATIAKVEGVADIDQTVLGNLCGALASTACGDEGTGPAIVAKLGAFAGAIAHLTGHKHFVLKASDARGGTRTTLETIPESEVRMAGVMLDKTADRYVIDKLRKMPEVAEIEARIAKKRAKAPGARFAH